MVRSEDAAAATADDATLESERDEQYGPETATAIIGGIVGGIAGALAFGILVWLLEPGFLRSSIPAMYGFEPTGTIGWTVHLLHGAVLGIVFAAIVSRRPVFEVLAPVEEPPYLGPMGLRTRTAAAGLAYGIAIWALVPIVVLPILGGIFRTDELQLVSTVAVESLIGHSLFGVVLGVVYAMISVRR